MQSSVEARVEFYRWVRGSLEGSEQICFGLAKLNALSFLVSRKGIKYLLGDLCCGAVFV